MTAAIPTQRHPGESNPEFTPVDACPYCGSLGPTCTDPGCLRQEIDDIIRQDRNEDY